MYIYQQLCAPGIKFKCLRWQSAVEAKISDHNPVLYTRKGQTYCSFNILTQCKFIVTDKGSYFNNGFNRVETDQEYEERLINYVIPIMAELVSKHNVDYFLLQEAPNNNTFVGNCFYTKLYQQLLELKTYVKSSYNTATGVLPFGGVLSIYLGESEVKKLENVSSELMQQISVPNQQRFQAIHLIMADDEVLKIANFHADYKDQDGTKKDILFLLSQGYLVGGDFNLLTSPGVHVPQKQALTVSGLSDGGRTYDAIYDGHEEKLVHEFSCLKLCW